MVSSSVREPSAAALASMVSILDIVSWSCLDGDAGIGLLAADGAHIEAPVHEWPVHEGLASTPATWQC